MDSINWTGVVFQQALEQITGGGGGSIIMRLSRRCQHEAKLRSGCLWRARNGPNLVCCQDLDLR